MAPLQADRQFSQIGYIGRAPTRPQSMAAGFDYTLSPTLLTDFRFGFYRQRIHVNPVATGSFAEDAGAPGLNIANDPTTQSMPRFQIGRTGCDSSLDILLAVPTATAHSLRQMQQFQFVNNWSWIHRNHTVKFGVDFRYLQNLRVPSDQHRSGQLYFEPDVTRGPDGGWLGHGELPAWRCEYLLQVRIQLLGCRRATESPILLRARHLADHSQNNTELWSPLGDLLPADRDRGSERRLAQLQYR